MLDEVDTRLLAEVQRDALITAEALGLRLNLSYITGYAARLDAGRLGLGVQAFIQVQMATHGREPAAAFARMIAGRAEVVSAWTLTGEADYLLRVYCTDLPALNRLIHQEFLPHPAVARVHSQIVMDQLKADTPLPV
jgi:DNA-binding Lrp family transcriptional regulator